MNCLIIDEKLPSMNEYVRCCRSNKYGGAEFKKSIESLIGWYIKKALAEGKLRRVDKPCEICIEWHEKTKRRDVDNIQSAQKFILDALQHFRIIKNDSRRYVRQIYHTVIDDTRDYVIVILKEV